MRLHQHDNEFGFVYRARKLNTASTFLPSAHCESHRVQFCTMLPHFTLWSWHQRARGLQSQPTASLYKEHCGMSPSGLIEHECLYCWLRLNEVMLRNVDRLDLCCKFVIFPCFLFFLVLLWLWLLSKSSTRHQWLILRRIFPETMKQNFADTLDYLKQGLEC